MYGVGGKKDVGTSLRSVPPRMSFSRSPAGKRLMGKEMGKEMDEEMGKGMEREKGWGEEQIPYAAG